ncbi:hypothetical protein JHK87_047345 [Glycine soja]|nr:hypothetical protein JHK87_047345 [Glycine soja]
MKLLPETPRTARRSSRPSVRPSTKVLVTNKVYEGPRGKLVRDFKHLNLNF